MKERTVSVLYYSEQKTTAEWKAGWQYDPGRL